MPPKSTALTKIETSNPAAEAEMSRSATDLAAWQAQASVNAKAVAQQLGYDGPLAPDILQQGIVEGKARIEFELFAIGARLVLLREQCAHGEFLQRLESLEIDPRAAQRYMQVALKFPNATTSAHLAKLGRSKLFELAMLDDSVLAVLESEGTVLGYKPDELEQMSVRELRSRLKEALATNEATDKLLANKDKKLNELSRKGQKVAFTDGVHIYSTLIEQIDAAKRQLKASYAEIDICISAALEVEGDEIDREGMNAARIALAQCIKDALDEPERMLQKVGKRFEDTIALLADEAAK
jgi:hypothetical protein